MVEFLKYVLKSVAVFALLVVGGLTLLVWAANSFYKGEPLPANQKASEAWKQSELNAAAAGREPAPLTTAIPGTDKMPVVKLTPKLEEVISVKGPIVGDDQFKIVRTLLPVAISMTSPGSFSADLRQVLRRNPKKIFIEIDSPGGSVLAGNQIISAIESAGVPVVTVCTGMCASMGLSIFMAGDSRYVTNRSILMAHPMSGASEGDVYQVRSQGRLMDRLSYRLDDYVAKRAGLSLEQYLQLVRGEYYADNEQAFAVGFSHGTAKFLVNTEGSVAWIPAVEQGRGSDLVKNPATVTQDSQDVKRVLESIQEQIPESVRTLLKAKW